MPERISELEKNILKTVFVNGANNITKNGFRNAAMLYFVYISDLYFLTSDPIKNHSIFAQNWERITNNYYTPSQLQNILSGLKFGKNNKETTPPISMVYLIRNMKIWEDKMMTELDQATPQNISECLFDLAQLQIRPSDTFINTCIRKLDSQWADVTILDIARIFKALADFAYLPDKPLLIKSCSQILNHRKWDQKTSNFLIWGITILDSLQHRTQYKQMAEHVFSLTTHLIQNTHMKKIMSDAALWFDLDKHQKLPDKEKEMKSTFERIVLRTLQRANIQYKRNYTIDRMAHTVDLQITYKDLNIIIECDGPYHFFYHDEGSFEHITAEYRGNTHFQSKLIKKLRPECTILRLSIFDFSNGYNLIAALDQVTALPDDIYASYMNNANHSTVVPLWSTQEVLQYRPPLHFMSSLQL